MSPRIEPIHDSLAPAETREHFRRAEERGAPNATLLRILARHPESLDAFYTAWNRSFYGGKVEHALKEIMRVRMARLRNCGY